MRHRWRVMARKNRRRASNAWSCQPQCTNLTEQPETAMTSLITLITILSFAAMAALVWQAPSMTMDDGDDTLVYYD
jgi:hypothetical protein